MSEIKALVKQSSHYFGGRILVALAGFISFPILTRIFSLSDYGILGLLNTTIFFAVIFAKFGFPSSIVRFYQEFQSSDRGDIFYSTTFLASIFIITFVAVLFFLTSRVLTYTRIPQHLLSVLTMVSFVVFTTAAIDIILSFLRAEQKTKLLNAIVIIQRYGSLGLALFFVFYWIGGLRGFYFGVLLAGTITLSLLICLCPFYTKISLRRFAPSFLLDAVKYGLPLTITESGHLFLNYADRYLIQLYLTSASLGLYVAGYNLAVYATEFLVHPMIHALEPIYMKILVDKGPQQTRQFLSEIFVYFTLLLVPLAFGSIAISEDLIGILAPTKFTAAHAIIPYVVFGQAIYACQLITNSGLFIAKKTHILTIFMLAACIFNIFLNILLIPSRGIVGAAQATLVTYSVYTIIVTHFSFKYFSFNINYKSILLYLIASLIMYYVISKIYFASRIVTLIMKIVVGIFVYVFIVLICDSFIRDKMYSIISSFYVGKMQNTN